METVTISPEFQVKIPENVREELQLLPGQKLSLYVRDGEIRLRKQHSIQDLRAIAKGIGWEDYRDRADRF